MRLTYLGTAAAEGWPGVFCNCEYCLKAKERGGKNIRTRSQALVNNDLIIDFPSDTNIHMLQNKLDLSAVKYVFFTHTHLDHCMPTDLFFRDESYYAHNLTEKSITLYGSSFVKARINSVVNAYREKPYGASFETIEAYKPVFVGDYKVTALRANHAYGETAFVYIVEYHGKTLLYLHDTGLLYDDVYSYLTENNIKADLVSYDCTFVVLPSGGGHLGLDSCQVVKKKLEGIGVVDSHTINIINHFSHNGKLIHDELVPVALELGFLTAYDGMVVEF